MSPGRRRTRLTVDDWVEAALAALAEGGVAAVAVEPLAARLGATKGSFYWHFDSRNDLVTAALERWERQYTQEIIDRIEAAPDPEAGLRDLLGGAMRSAFRDRLGARLLADADRPEVADIVRRVVTRRVGYLVQLFEQVGFAPDGARHRAALLYAAYLGHEQLSLRLPGVLDLADDYLSSIIELVLMRPNAGREPGASGPDA